MKRKSAALAVAAALAHVLVLAQPAAAYIDPGAGSYLWQLLIGTFMGGIVAVGVFWTRVRAFFARRFGRGDASPATPDRPADPAPETVQRGTEKQA